jgi:hypothetical protein
LTSRRRWLYLEDMLRRVSRLLTTCLGCCSFSACAMPQELPGELVGAYRITGALIENSCGSAALPAADSLDFNVEIREQDGSGLWLVGAPPGHLGSLAESGDFSFQRESTYDVGGQARQPVELLIEKDIERLADPQAAQQLGESSTQPCRLSVSERIAGTLLRDNRPAEAEDETEDARAGEGARLRDRNADLIGANEITVRVAAGDCRPSLDDNGGPFEQLPCEVRYDLEGELIAP